MKINKNYLLIASILFSLSTNIKINAKRINKAIATGKFQVASLDNFFATITPINITGAAKLTVQTTATSNAIFTITYDGTGMTIQNGLSIKFSDLKPTSASEISASITSALGKQPNAQAIGNAIQNAIMLGIANPLFNVIVQNIYKNKSFIRLTPNDLTILSPYFTKDQLLIIKPLPSNGLTGITPLFTEKTGTVTDEVQIQLLTTPTSSTPTTISYSFSQGAMIIQNIDERNNALVPLYLNRFTDLKTFGTLLGSTISSSYTRGYQAFNSLPAGNAIGTQIPSTTTSIASAIGTAIQNGFNSTTFSENYSSSSKTLIQSIIQQGFWGSAQLTSLINSTFIYVYNLAVNGIDAPLAKPYSYTSMLNPIQNYLFPENTSITANGKTYTIFYNKQQMVIQNIDGGTGSIVVPLINIGYPSITNITNAINSSLKGLAFIPPVNSTITSLTIPTNDTIGIATSIGNLFSTNTVPTLCNKIVQAIPQGILNTLTQSDYLLIKPYTTESQNSSWEQNLNTQSTNSLSKIGSFKMQTEKGIFSISYNQSSMMIENIDGKGLNITVPFSNILLNELNELAATNIVHLDGTQLTIAQKIGMYITLAIFNNGNRTNNTISNSTISNSQIDLYSIATAIGNAFTSSITNQESINLLSKIIQTIPVDTIKKLTQENYNYISMYCANKQDAARLDPNQNTSAPTPQSTSGNTTLNISGLNFNICYDNTYLAIKNIDGLNTHTIIGLKSLASSIKYYLTMGFALNDAIRIAFFCSIFYGYGIYDVDGTDTSENITALLDKNDVTGALTLFLSKDRDNTINNFNNNNSLNNTIGSQITSYQRGSTTIQVPSSKDNIENQINQDNYLLNSYLQKIIESFPLTNTLSSINTANNLSIFTLNTTNSNSTTNDPLSIMLSIQSFRRAPSTSGINLALTQLITNNTLANQITASISATSAAISVATSVGSMLVKASALAAAGVGTGLITAQAMLGPISAVAALAYSVYTLLDAFGVFDSTAEAIPVYYDYYPIIQHGFMYGKNRRAIRLDTSKTSILNEAIALSNFLGNALSNSSQNDLLTKIISSMDELEINNLPQIIYSSLSNYFNQGQRNNYYNFTQTQQQLTVGNSGIKYTQEKIEFNNFDDSNNNIVLLFSKIGNAIETIVNTPEYSQNSAYDSSKIRTLIAAGIFLAASENLGNSVISEKFITLINNITDPYYSAQYGTAQKALLPIFCKYLGAPTFRKINNADYNKIKDSLPQSSREAIDSIRAIPQETILTVQQTEEFKTLTPSQIQALTPSQIQALTGEQLQALSTSQIGAFSGVQIGLMSQAQITYLLARLTPPQIGSLTSAQIQGLTELQIASFTAAQIQSFTRVQIQALTLPQIKNLTQRQIQALTDAQNNVLKLDQIQAFTETQIPQLTPAQIVAFSYPLTPQQVSWITTEQLQNLTLTALNTNWKYLLEKLNTKQLAAITQTKLALLSQAYQNQFNPQAPSQSSSNFSQTFTDSESISTTKKLQDFLTYIASKATSTTSAGYTIKFDMYGVFGSPVVGTVPSTTAASTNFGGATALGVQQFKKNNGFVTDYQFGPAAYESANKLIANASPSNISAFNLTKYTGGILLPGATETNSVKVLQNFLTYISTSPITQSTLGKDVIFDNYGTYGIGTIAAVKQFQLNTGLLTSPTATKTSDNVVAGIFAGQTIEKANSLIPSTGIRAGIYMGSCGITTNTTAQAPIPVQAPGTMLTPTPALTPIPGSLQLNTNGRFVEKLQDFLTALDFPVINTDNQGVFGSATKKAVQRFQKDNHLEATGVFKGHSITKANRTIEKDNSTNKTLSSLPLFSTTALKHGNKGLDVKKLQKFLIHRNYLDTYGTFGPATHAAVKQFQRLNNLPTTGIFDEKTAEIANSLGA